MKPIYIKLSLAFALAMSYLGSSMAVEETVLVINTPAVAPQPSGPGCNVINLQGPISFGFLGWIEGQTIQAIWVDPTGSGGAGAPGCAGTFAGQEFNITNVNFTLADGTLFGSPNGETGIGVTTYTVSIVDAATPGDLLSGPGALLASVQQMLTLDASGFYSVNVPFNVNVTGPVFVTIRFDDFNPDIEVTTTLWDNVPRPLGRQWMSTDNATTWVDMTNFFMGGSNGWVDMTVSGNFVPAGGPALPPPPSVPALNTLGLGALVLALMLATLFAIRRRHS